MTSPRPRRTFNPKKTARYGRPAFDPDVLVKYSPKRQYSRLMNFPFSGSHFRPRMHTLVVAVDGGCRSNARNDPHGRAACAVFFGPGSKDNHASMLNPNEAQTSNRAELHAALMALGIVDVKVRRGELDLVREIILITDSEYVARSMNQWVWNWERNGWTTSRGGDVENRDLMERLHGRIKGLERGGIAVRFWRVQREWNEEADRLVNETLDREMGGK